MRVTGPSSMTSAGRDCDSSAKKKSGPMPDHAVPSLSCFSSKVAPMASWSLARSDLDFASAISFGAVGFIGGE